MKNFRVETFRTEEQTGEVVNLKDFHIWQSSNIVEAKETVAGFA